MTYGRGLLTAILGTAGILAAAGVGGAFGGTDRITRDVTAAGTAFSPQTLTVQTGDTVHWAATGGSHNVVFDDGSFTNGPVASHLNASRVFPTPGTYTYFCAQHQASGMTGTRDRPGGAVRRAGRDPDHGRRRPRRPREHPCRRGSAAAVLGRAQPQHAQAPGHGHAHRAGPGHRGGAGRDARRHAVGQPDPAS